MATKRAPVTTLAVGEEDRPDPTTLAVGEEEAPPQQDRRSTTLRVGEEGGGGDGPPPTPYVEDGEDERRHARGVVPQDNPLGAF